MTTLLFIKDKDLAAEFCTELFHFRIVVSHLYYDKESKSHVLQVEQSLDYINRIIDTMGFRHRRHKILVIAKDAGGDWKKHRNK